MRGHLLCEATNFLQKRSPSKTGSTLLSIFSEITSDRGFSKSPLLDISLFTYHFRGMLIQYWIVSFFSSYKKLCIHCAFFAPFVSIIHCTAVFPHICGYSKQGIMKCLNKTLLLLVQTHIWEKYCYVRYTNSSLWIGSISNQSDFLLGVYCIYNSSTATLQNGRQILVMGCGCYFICLLCLVL